MAQAIGREHDGSPVLAEPYDLAALDEAVLNAVSYEQMMDGVSGAVAPVLGAELCGVMIWEPVQDALQLLPGSFGAGKAATASYRVSSSDVSSNAARVFATRTPYVSNRAREDPSILQDYNEAFRIWRLLTLPLGVGEQRTGVIHFANRDAPFEPKDVMVARRVAPRVAVAVEYMRNLLRLRRQEGLEGILRHVAEAIASGAPLDRILERAFEELLLISGAQCVLLSVAGAEPILRGCEQSDAANVRQFLEDSRNGPRGVHERLARPDRAGDPGWAALHVPVLVSEEYLGTLSLLRSRAEPLSQDERTAMERLADLIALAWATERYQQERAAKARLSERERIAEDLHDHVAQILFATKTALEAALESPTISGPPRDAVTRARELLARGEESMREVIEELSPTREGDPAERLERVVHAVQEQFGIAVHLELPREQLPRSSTATDLLVKACREALVNAAKHAGPSRVSVSLGRARGGRLLLTVLDDGIGIVGCERRDGHGLKALRRAVREHGGALRVARRPMGGTKLTMSIDP